MREHLQAIVTVLSLVNPVVCGAMFARIEVDRARDKQMADATSVSLTVLVNSSAGRPGRDSAARPLRRVPRRLHGGGWRGTGMDGVFHAQRQRILTTAAGHTCEL